MTRTEITATLTTEQISQWKSWQTELETDGLIEWDWAHPDQAGCEGPWAAEREQYAYDWAVERFSTLAHIQYEGGADASFDTLLKVLSRALELV